MNFLRKILVKKRKSQESQTVGIERAAAMSMHYTYESRDQTSLSSFPQLLGAKLRKYRQSFCGTARENLIDVCVNTFSWWRFLSRGRPWQSNLNTVILWGPVLWGHGRAEDVSWCGGWGCSSWCHSLRKGVWAIGALSWAIVWPAAHLCLNINKNIETEKKKIVKW